MAGITFGLAQENPAAGLGTKNVILVLERQNTGGILLRSSAAQRQLAKVTKRWQRGSMYRQFVFAPRTHGGPSRTDLLPHGVHFIPVFGIFLPQPLSLTRTRHDEVKPERSAVGISAGINHMVVDF